jgi:phage shock protein C
MASISRPRGTVKRSRSDRMIGGVCAGVAKYFELDPVIVRLLFVVLALAQGAGVLLYLVLLVVLPEEDAAAPATAAPAAGAPDGAPAPTAPAPHWTPVETRRRRGVLAGALLIALGAYLFVVNLGLLWWWDWKFAGPATLIAAGLLVLFCRLR